MSKLSEPQLTLLKAMADGNELICRVVRFRCGTKMVRRGTIVALRERGLIKAASWNHDKYVLTDEGMQIGREAR